MFHVAQPSSSSAAGGSFPLSSSPSLCYAMLCYAKSTRLCAGEGEDGWMDELSDLTTDANSGYDSHTQNLKLQLSLCVCVCISWG